MSGKSETGKKKRIASKLRISAHCLEMEANEYIIDGRENDADRKAFGRQAQKLRGMARFLRFLAERYAP